MDTDKKYDKKIAKHYQRLCDGKYLDSALTMDCAHKLYSLCRLGLAFNCHGFTASSCRDKTEKAIYSAVDSASSIESSYTLSYATALEFLCSTKRESDISMCNKIFDLFIQAADNCDFLTGASSLEGIATYYSITKAPRALNFITKIVQTYEDNQFTASSDLPTRPYFCFALGLIKTGGSFYSVATEVSGKLFAAASAINYGIKRSFNENITDPIATAQALELAVLLYKTGRGEYLTRARRIWFNGMQFCQRDNGGVGTDEVKPLLKINYYEDENSPLYAKGLKVYNDNKLLFKDSEDLIKKDSAGRIMSGDKMFALDESGFFGKDLIEIPTLTAFSKETGYNLKMKLIF